MIDVQVLVDDLNISGLVTLGWSIDHAWTMAPVEPEEIPAKIPFLSLYQGSETFTAREGSPCFQTARYSSVIAVVLCRKTQLKSRLNESREAMLGWGESPDGVDSKLFLSDGFEACGPVQIKGEYIWWRDVYQTTYPLVFD